MFTLLHKGSAIVIINKADYTADTHKQLSNPQLNESTNIDLTGEKTQSANFHVYHMIQRSPITEKH